MNKNTRNIRNVIKNSSPSSQNQQKFIVNSGDQFLNRNNNLKRPQQQLIKKSPVSSMKNGSPAINRKKLQIVR